MRITIRVNDTEMEIDGNATLAELIDTFSSNDAKGVTSHQAGLAVALNQQVIAKHSWPSTLLQAQDQVTLFQAIAGG